MNIRLISILKSWTLSQKAFWLAVVFMFLCFITASIFQYKYTVYPTKDLDIKLFQSQLNNKIAEADQQLLRLMSKVLLNKDGFEKQNSNTAISYYIYKNDSLVYWSENEIGIPQLFLDFNKKTSFVAFQHSDCIYRYKSEHNYKFVALIHIKNNYSEPNNFLQNSFDKDFNIDPKVKINAGSPEDKYAVFSPEKDYLFSLDKENSKIYNKTLSIWSMWFWILGLLLLYILSKNIHIPLGKKEFDFKLQAYTLFSWLLLLFIGIKWNEPWMMFQQDFFSPIHYASNALLASMGHLSLITLFALSEIGILFQLVNKSKGLNWIRKIKHTTHLSNIISALSFVLLINLMSQLIYNSSFDIRLYLLEHVSSMTFYAVIIIFFWLVTFVLIRLTCNKLSGTNKSFKTKLISHTISSIILAVCLWFWMPEYSYTSLWYWGIIILIDYLQSRKVNLLSTTNILALVLAFVLFEVYFAVNTNRDKMQAKIKTMAENINSGEIIDRNFFAEILFEELNEELFDDENLLEISNKKDSVRSEIQSYLTKNYFRGFWNNYDIKTYLFDQENPKRSDLERLAFYNYILSKTDRVKKTNFYFCTEETSKIDYIGVFDLHNEILFIEFYSKLRTSSYSYPEPLLQAERINPLNASLSIARYKNGFVSSQIGDYEYPMALNWINNNQKAFYHFDKNKFRHYVYKPNNSTTIIISEPINSFYYVFIVYAAYLLGLYVILAALGTLIIKGFRKELVFRYSYLSRLQFTFIILFIISFIGIFLISTTYIISQYQDKQENELEKKNKYISQYLSETLKENVNLKMSNVVDLNFLLQELSKTFETDIHIYDTKGYLVASSQPIIFAKGLISYRISPTPFFDGRSNKTLNENIGKLQYISTYTNLYNEKGQLLGYIAVPSFLSSDEIRKEIFSFLSVIINIYLLITFIALLASYLVNRRLSQPIKALESKLRTISLKGENERLEYKHNDEIGHLVEQYNLMVDELENSAEKLAQSERESAWKQMARQVTHEINNPLTPMKLTIQQLQRMQSTDDERFNEYFSRSAEMLIEQIEHLSTIATAFSDFAKMPETNVQQVNIVSRLESAINLFKNNKEGVKISYTPVNQHIYIRADKEQLTQIFTNLLKNAIQAIPSDREGTIDTFVTMINNKLRIEFKDNGSGISPDIQDKLFEPNFTTKNSGMGLGLAIVKNMVESNGGKIWFETNQLRGTSFFLDFPLS